MALPRIASLQDLNKVKKAVLDEQKQNASKRKILLCSGASCIASGSLQLKKALEQKIKEEGLDVEVVETGCLGPCAQGPVIVVSPDQTFYENLKVEDARDIVDGSVGVLAIPEHYLVLVFKFVKRLFIFCYEFPFTVRDRQRKHFWQALGP